MATKKRTTKRAPAPKHPAQDPTALTLARHISAILNNPATPVCIYNALADAVCELDAPKGYWDSVQYMTALLAYNLRNGGNSDA